MPVVLKDEVWVDVSPIQCKCLTVETSQFVQAHSGEFELFCVDVARLEKPPHNISKLDGLSSEIVCREPALEPVANLIICFCYVRKQIALKHLVLSSRELLALQVNGVDKQKNAWWFQGPRAT